MVAAPRAALRGGRRGRDTGRKRSSHAKKSKSPRGRNTAKPVSSTIAAIQDGAAVTVSSTTAAAIAIKTKGGKAGAYLRRISGERDLSGDPECEEDAVAHEMSVIEN